ncbi:MAG TPA: site-specific DNA-methyltransferase, partial [Planctomycetota bacterium]|nr:site-specific DNA-methyltransferase [Planctomycetota bacterium]
MLDKAAGAEREAVGIRPKSQSYGGGINQIYGDGADKNGIQYITAPATALAKTWDGWGTALKPAAEEWI